jgi:hypothetical protein
MLKLVFLIIALTTFAMVAVVLIFTVLALVATALAIGIPLYFLLKPHLSGRSLGRLSSNSIERLQRLYVEGKIDLFEFERRVAHLLAIEQ